MVREYEETAIRIKAQMNMHPQAYAQLAAPDNLNRRASDLVPSAKAIFDAIRGAVTTFVPTAFARIREATEMLSLALEDGLRADATSRSALGGGGAAGGAGGADFPVLRTTYYYDTGNVKHGDITPGPHYLFGCDIIIAQVCSLLNSFNLSTLSSEEVEADGLKMYHAWAHLLSILFTRHPTMLRRFRAAMYRHVPLICGVPCCFAGAGGLVARDMDASKYLSATDGAPLVRVWAVGEAQTDAELRAQLPVATSFLDENKTLRLAALCAAMMQHERASAGWNVGTLFATIARLTNLLNATEDSPSKEPSDVTRDGIDILAPLTIVGAFALGQAYEGRDAASKQATKLLTAVRAYAARKQASRQVEKGGQCKSLLTSLVPYLEKRERGGAGPLTLIATRNPGHMTAAEYASLSAADEAAFLDGLRA